VSDGEPPEAEWNAWRAEGKTAAEQALLHSSGPILLKDEYGPMPQDMAKAMGWNAVWASEENRRRLQRWHELSASNPDSKSRERMAAQLQKVMGAACAVGSSTETLD